MPCWPWVAPAASSVLISSSSNNFTNVLSGATLQVQQATGQPVSITIGVSNTGLVNAVQALVTDYNSYNTTLTNDTSYNTSSNTGAILSDDPTATELSTVLSNLLSGQVSGTGSIQSLSQLGVTFNQDGSLSFDSSQLQNQYASNPDGVKQFFTQTTTGLANQLDNTIENLAGQNNSLLSTRMSALSDTMSKNNDKITSMNTMLSNQRQLLYNQFYQMEVSLSQMQTSMNIVNSLSMVGSDGTSTGVFGNDYTNPLSNMSNLANVVAAGAQTQANALLSNATTSSSSTSSTSSSTSSS